MNQPQERNWWNRNWKWFVPVGCLGAIVSIVGFGKRIDIFFSDTEASTKLSKKAIQKLVLKIYLGVV